MSDMATFIAELYADAEQLAARYEYNVDRLWFQYERRLGGSFATTIDGSPKERDRYFRAWKIAVARRHVREELTGDVLA